MGKDENIGFNEYIDTLILRIYRYIVFINYLNFKDIFNLYIKINLKVYEMIISIRFEKNIKNNFL